MSSPERSLGHGGTWPNPLNRYALPCQSSLCAVPAERTLRNCIPIKRFAHSVEVDGQLNQEQIKAILAKRKNTILHHSGMALRIIGGIRDQIEKNNALIVELT
jgi:hypothetical protein